MSRQIVTPEARLAFPALFVAAVNKADPSKPAKFGATLLFPKTADISALKALMLETATEKWGAEALRNPAFKLKNPILDGDVKCAERVAEGKTPWDGYAGCVFIRATTSVQPQVFDQECKLIPALQQKRVYAGMYVRAQVHCFAWENINKKGVSFGIDSIQIVRDGKPFVGQLDEDGAKKTFGVVPGGKNDSNKYPAAATDTGTAAPAPGPFDN